MGRPTEFAEQRGPGEAGVGTHGTRSSVSRLNRCQRFEQPHSEARRAAHEVRCECVVRSSVRVFEKRLLVCLLDE